MGKYLYLLALALGFALGMGLTQHQVADQKAAHAKTLQDIAEKTTAAKDAQLTYYKVAQSEITKLSEENDAYKKQIKADAESAKLARDEWLLKLSKLSKRPTSSGGETKPRSESIKDQATFDLFTELLSRDSEALLTVGSYAEELKAAGLKCEGEADVWSNPQFQQPSQ